MIQFIHQDPKNRSLSASDRKIVRKVSNKAAAATRKAKGPGAKINTLQLPDFLALAAAADSGYTGKALVDDDQDEGCVRYKPERRTQRKRSTSTTSSKKYDYATPLMAALSLWPNNSKSPEYVSLLMQPGLSQKLLVDASGLGLNSDPRRWVKICRLTSVLRFLPLMIGHSTCLDCAIDCLAERVRQCCVTSPDMGLAQVQLERRYGCALQNLQNALTTTSKVDWTMWYTTLLLALFELLENSSHRAWVLHASGAKHILVTLGPRSINTEYEKIMLVAQCQILTVEAIYKNDECVLSKAAWQRALQSAIDYNSPTPDRSEAVVTMWMITACAPSLFKRATEAVLNQHSPDRVANLADELRTLLERYSSWREKWENNLVGEDFPIINDAMLAKAGPTIYPQYLAFSALTNRFLVALQPHEAPVAESNAINAALRIIEFDQIRETDSVVDLCRTFSASIAHSIKVTTMEWTMQQYASREAHTVEPAVFLRWNNLLDRAT